MDLDDASVELGPWLPGLPLSIALDQPVLAHMRYYAAKSDNAHWTCPLRQMSLWSAQDPSFLPAVPNPLRASRLYSKITNPYVTDMNVHPTTKAIRIDVATRLHSEYWTTNGFCVYKGGASMLNGQGVVPPSEECSLYALAKSVLSQEYNNYTTVFADVCLSQVDWPYHPIHGRDGSLTAATEATNCAVLDRLPHFRYRIKTNAPFQVRVRVRACVLTICGVRVYSWDVDDEGDDGRVRACVLLGCG